MYLYSKSFKLFQDFNVKNKTLTFEGFKCVIVSSNNLHDRPQLSSLNCFSINLIIPSYKIISKFVAPLVCIKNT